MDQSNLRSLFCPHTFRLSWKPFATWWTPSVLSQNGCTTSSSDMGTQTAPTTPECPTKSPHWILMTHSCPSTTWRIPFQVTKWRSPLMTLPFRYPLSGQFKLCMYACFFNIGSIGLLLNNNRNRRVLLERELYWPREISLKDQDIGL